MGYDEDLRNQLDQIVNLGATATEDTQKIETQKKANTDAAKAKSEQQALEAAQNNWTSAQKAALSKASAAQSKVNLQTQSQIAQILGKQAISNAAQLAKQAKANAANLAKNSAASEAAGAGGGGGKGGAYIPPSSGAGNTFDNFVAAIVSVESGGRYNAIGPAVGNNQHAYGKYQIMQGNIPSWSKAALGHSITPQQFLKSPALQDKIALYFLSGYYKKYGPAGAAMAWNGGPGSVGNRLSGYALTVLRRMGVKR